MRIGVIGVGRIGQFHADYLRGHKDVTALVLTDADPGRVREVSDRLGASFVTTAEELIDSVDAVVITSPTSTHADLLHKVVDAKKPTFCEKPIALDLQATRSVVRHVQDSGATVQIGFQRRFDFGYKAARKAVVDGSLGRVYLARMASHDPYPPHEDYLPGSGGIFRDMHIHDYDVVSWVLGQEIVEVYAKGAVLVDPMFSRNNDFDTVAAMLTFSDGTLGVLTGARHDPVGHDVRLELFGSGNSIVAGWDERTPMISLQPNSKTHVEKPYTLFLDRFADAYRSELDAFVDLVCGRAENPCGVEAAEKALTAAIACEMSRKENRPVSLSEVGS